MRVTKLGLAVLVASLAACATTPPVSPGDTRRKSLARVRLKRCNVPGVDEPLLCGRYAVWENRATKRGRKIDLNIVVVPSLSSTPSTDAVAVLAGGPGDFATGAAAGWAQDRAIRAHRDILLVDQRGTGSSHRLDCRLPRDPGDIQGYFEPPLPPDEVERCRARLAKSTDLAQYTTSIAADDLDEVRAWLGYDKLDLHGGSYGTRAAQVYLRLHPNRVRTATLIGVVGMDQYLPLYHAADGKRALDLLLAACARDTACSTAFPDIYAELARVLAALDANRGTATVERPPIPGDKSGAKGPVTVTIPRDIFAEQIRFSLYNALTSSATPYILHRAAQGDFGPFARFALLWEPNFRAFLAWGMNLSVSCAEDVPFITPEAIARETEGTYLRGYRVLQQVAACRAWPRGEIPDDFHAPVVSTVPTLMLSGPYDPVTPPRWADQAAAMFSSGLHVVIPEAHHGSGGLSHPECLRAITAQFIERGTTERLDTSCVATMKPPPFVTDEASFAALLKQLGD